MRVWAAVGVARPTVAVTVAAGLVAVLAAPVAAPAAADVLSAGQARQDLIRAESDADAAAQRATVAADRVATARARVTADVGWVRSAARQLRRTMRAAAPAHRRTVVAGLTVARANTAADDAARAAASAAAAMHRTAREAYMNGAASSDLAMLLGFASDGPGTLADLARHSLAVARVENRSVGDADAAAAAAQGATAAARAALAAYGESAQAEAQAQAAVARARQRLAGARAELRAAQAAQARAVAALSRARAAIAAADRAESRARTAYRHALATAPPGFAGDPGVSAAPVSTGGKAELVWNTLRCNGFSEESTAGILGNLQQESNVDPTAIQSGGPGMGLAQWSRGGRWDTGPNSLLAFAAARGLDPWSAQTQTEFMIFEMSAAWGGFDLPAFQRSTDVVAATIYFHDVYEVSADNPEFVAAVRGGYALQWYGILHGSAPRGC